MKINFYLSVRVGITAILIQFLLLPHAAKAQQYLTKIDGWNAYVHLPDDYNDGTLKKYPLICFIPGLGECGTDASKLMVHGPARFIAAGNNMQFMVNGKLEKPIVISLQPANVWPNAATLNRKLDSIFKRFRCDLQRVNATGLSMGGWSWNNFVDNYNPIYTNKITSIVSMSAPPPDNGIGNMKHFSLAGGTMWAFEGSQDWRGLSQIVDTLNKAVAGSGRYTRYIGGHCCWNDFYNPDFMENGESIYTWMLKQKKSLIQGPQSPEADAGRDSATSAVTSSVALEGNGNDPNGLPINFTWVKISGPAGGSISNATAMQTVVTGLGMGEYKYELSVRNALGLIGKDTMTFRNGLGVLPVVLESFTGNLNSDATVKLFWKTSTEINSNYFLVEKSTDGQAYTTLTKIAASSNGSGGNVYAATDFLPAKGANFYRLKMVDMDGSYEYSKIINIQSNKANAAKVAINTAFSNGSSLTVNINSSEVSNGSIALLDGSGKLLFTQKVALNAGMNLIKKDIAISRGVYHISLITNNEKIVRSIIYQ